MLYHKEKATLESDNKRHSFKALDSFNVSLHGFFDLRHGVLGYKTCPISHMKLKITTYFLVIIYAQQALTFFAGINLPKEAPSFQCMLTQYDTSLKRNMGICSGTYLNKNIFLTAAHCFNKLTLGNKFEDDIVSYIQCRTDHKKVKAVAVHPFFHRNTRDLIDFNEKVLSDGVTLNTNSIGFLSYNDIALAYTDDVNISDFPNINWDSNFNPEKKSCRFLGFSPHLCEPVSGNGCYRSNFSVEKSYDNNVLSCDLDNGEGCYSLNSELKASPYFFKKEGAQSGKGDSGAGVLCKDSSTGMESLIGVNTSRSKENQILSILNRSDFILKHLNLVEEEFIKASQNYKIAPTLKDNLLIAHRIEKMLYDHSVSISTNGLLTGKAALLTIRSWVESDLSLSVYLLKKNDIKHIEVNNSNYTFGVWKTIRGLKAFIKEGAEGNVLVVRPNVTNTYIEQALL